MTSRDKLLQNEAKLKEIKNGKGRLIQATGVRVPKMSISLTFSLVKVKTLVVAFLVSRTYICPCCMLDFVEGRIHSLSRLVFGLSSPRL